MSSSVLYWSSLRLHWLACCWGVRACPCAALSKCSTSTSVSSLIAPRLRVDYDDSASTEEARQTKRDEIFQQIIARVSALPGVEAAGISDYLPLGPEP